MNVIQSRPMFVVVRLIQTPNEATSMLWRPIIMIIHPPASHYHPSHLLKNAIVLQ